MIVTEGTLHANETLSFHHNKMYLFIWSKIVQTVDLDLHVNLVLATVMFLCPITFDTTH